MILTKIKTFLLRLKSRIKLAWMYPTEKSIEAARKATIKIFERYQPKPNYKAIELCFRRRMHYDGKAEQDYLLDQLSNVDKHAVQIMLQQNSRYVELIMTQERLIVDELRKISLKSVEDRTN